MTIDIKIKRNGRWQDMNVADFCDHSLNAFLIRWDGEDMRIRVEENEKTYYIAGTPEIAAQLKKKSHGRVTVMTPVEFWERAKKMGMENVMLAPVSECFQALFPGSVVEQINLFGGEA